MRRTPWATAALLVSLSLAGPSTARQTFANYTAARDPLDVFSLRDDRPDGTGMGLHVCATLATLMGGRIEVQSQPGEGSCFSLVMEGG